MLGDGDLPLVGEPRNLEMKNWTLGSYLGYGWHPAGCPWTAPTVKISMHCLALVFVGPVLKRGVNSRLPPLTRGPEMLDDFAGQADEDPSYVRAF